MSDVPVVSSLWIGPKFSFLEKLCMTSFIDAGHPTKLYTYAPVQNVPDGVEVCDANEILPCADPDAVLAAGLAAQHSDRFRYILLSKTDEIWVDTDAYCLRQFPKAPYMFSCHFKDLVANGVLRLPKESPTLQSLIAFTDTEYPDLPDDFPYLRRTVRAEYAARRDAGDPMHVGELPWEIWGPFALTYFLRMHGEIDHRLPSEVLYPLGGSEIVRTLWKRRRIQITMPPNTLSVHFYGSSLRTQVKRRDGAVPPKSYLGRLCTKHGIDPSSPELMIRPD